MAVPCKLVLFNFFIIVSSSPIYCLIVTFPILSCLDILKDLLRASISVALTRLLLFSASLHALEPYNKLLLINAFTQVKLEGNLYTEHVVTLLQVS
jgi:hypothetical protein